ncbi:MAG TPA: hypothetical protein VLA52_02420 [Thermohalobaculum sp.]|nr:hypothetical protein [Thermohalobaculum sp.]
MNQMRRMFPSLVTAFCLSAPTASAQTYEACLELLTEDPARAEMEAAEWVRAGGGAAAGHCRALALLALGADQRAAEQLVEIATGDRTLPDSVRAELLIDAGRIYMGIGALEAAQDAVRRSLRLATDPRAALTLSAQVKAELQDWAGAAGDLDGALAHGEPDPELLALRASARRRLGQLDLAREDLRRAEALAPESATVWLERGALEEAGGNKDAARAAWLRAVELDRDGPVGAAARLRMQKLEAGG